MRLRAMAGWYIGLLDPGGRETLSVGGEFSGRESLGRELISSVIYKRVNFGQKIGRIEDGQNRGQTEYRAGRASKSMAEGAGSSFRLVALLFLVFLFYRSKADSRLIKITVHQDFKGTALKLCQALGNGQS